MKLHLTAKDKAPVFGNFVYGNHVPNVRTQITKPKQRVAGFGGAFTEAAARTISRMSEAMTAVIIVLVFAASISTLSSLVMASSSTLTLDFLKGHVIKKMSDKLQLFIIRALIVVFIIISSIIAIIQYKGGITFIAQLMGVSWGALAGAFLAPFLYGLYWKRTSNAAVWCCFIFSTSLMLLNIFFRSSFPVILQSPINAGAFAMLAGLVIVPVVSILTKSPEKALINNCFSCYEQTVNVKVSGDLGDN